MLRQIIILVAVIICGSSALDCANIDPPIDSNGAVGCVYDCIPYFKDEKFDPPGQCIRGTCLGNNSTGMLGCALTFGNAKCYVGYNYKLPYPGCCPHYTC